MNYLEAAFAPITAYNREVVLADAFGHLAPEVGRTYEGWIVIARSVYNDGEVVIVNEDFGLDGSPWWMEHLQEFGKSLTLEEGAVYRWTGTYRVFKNGNYRFSGKAEKLSFT